MRITSARIRAYRTIKDEITLDLRKGLTLVGPNNVGKTNILKAIRLFFTGHENELGYQRDRDLSFGQSSLRTSIALSFDISEESDADARQLLQGITDALEVDNRTPNELAIYLTFSSSSNPSYRLFPNSRRPTVGAQQAAYSRLERQLVFYVLNAFRVHYIPSDKSTEQLYRDLVLPFLFKKCHSAVSNHLDLITESLSEVAQGLNGSLTNAGIPGVECRFKFPQRPEDVFADVAFALRDPGETSIFDKGMGVQSAALLAAFCWITREEISEGRAVLWLLEEPESYLHPELASQCEKLIAELRSVSQVLGTTHSLAFVPQDPERVVGVMLEEGWSKIESYKTYWEASRRIRSSLGVKFSDFYNLNVHNVFVEGESDRVYLEYWQLLLRQNGLQGRFPHLCSDQVSFLDHGGVKGLEGFARATYQFIRNERVAVFVFDGDSAGDLARRALVQFFGQKNIQFRSNREYLVVRDRFAIEGLFPDRWILECFAEHPGWFEDCSTDTDGTLLPFEIKSGSKKQFQNWALTRVAGLEDVSELVRWESFLVALEDALQLEAARVYAP